jgi:hypothetical protein
MTSILPRKPRYSQTEYNEFVSIGGNDREEREGGPLATAHISPRPKIRLGQRPRFWTNSQGDSFFMGNIPSPKLEYEGHYKEEILPSVTYCKNGVVNRVELGRSVRPRQGVGGASKRDEKQAHFNLYTPKRSAVNGFSKGSRRRLMRKIGEVDTRCLPLFVTLTYPDEIFSQRLLIGKKQVDGNSWDRWKRDIDVLGKRVLRAFPKVGFIWRMELQDRKSGGYIGEIVPHFHIMLWGGTEYQVKGWLKEAWYQVVGSGNPDHLAHGVDVTTVRSVSGAMFYTSKYVAKEEGVLEGVQTGRLWGVIGRGNIPLSEKEFVELTKDEAVLLARIGRKYIRMRGKSFKTSITFLMDGENIRRWIEFIRSSE